MSIFAASRMAVFIIKMPWIVEEFAMYCCTSLSTRWGSRDVNWLNHLQVSPKQLRYSHVCSLYYFSSSKAPTPSCVTHPTLLGKPGIFAVWLDDQMRESKKSPENLDQVCFTVLVTVCVATTKGEALRKSTQTLKERDERIKMCCPNKGKAFIAVVVMLAAFIIAIACIYLVIGVNVYWSIPLAPSLVTMGVRHVPLDLFHGGRRCEANHNDPWVNKGGACMEDLLHL